MAGVASVVVDPFDGPEVAQIIVAVITFAGVVFTGGVALRANRNASRANVNAAAARSQVENDHSLNLREDYDQKHDEQKQLITATLNLSRHNATALRKISADVGLLKEGWRANRDDIDSNTSRIEKIEEHRLGRRRKGRDDASELPADDDA